MIGIKISNSYELCVKGGALVLGETTPQNQALIIESHKGAFKENPAIGVGVSDMLLDNDPLYWRRRIREALEIDKQSVESIKITNRDIHINAHY